MTLSRAASRAKPTTNTVKNIRKIIIGAPRVAKLESQGEYRRDTSSSLGWSCADLCVPHTNYLSLALFPGIGADASDSRGQISPSTDPTDDVAILTS